MPGPVNLADYQKRLSHMEAERVRLIQRIADLELLLCQTRGDLDRESYLAWCERREELLNHEENKENQTTQT